MKALSLLLLSAGFLGLSCSKNSEGNNDREAPVIIMSTPADNQSFTSGQQVQIAGAITDNNYIKEIHLEIHNVTTSQVLLHQHIHPGGANYALSHSFSIPAAGNYEIRVIAEDPAGQITSSKLRVSGN